ncbi:hypothetical protein RU93_GL000531 [Enterococcus aquimarinus]|uniref:Uncharacterized protein n=1 Tax=Enterococcus aquimarinus TaxID=328396 RepID=A0A1L8QQU7_9ENTE|nr:hypothetical protein RU93_GL000531 [Enterococcus aquimarinus]
MKVLRINGMILSVPYSAQTFFDQIYLHENVRSKVCESFSFLGKSWYTKV